MTSPTALKTPPGAQDNVTLDQRYEFADTRALVTLVSDAAELIRTTGESAFDAFRVPDSRWRAEESYIFVLDPDGTMLVHPDPALEGKNQLDLKDVGGRPIIRGLIAAAMAIPAEPEGWYHYQWFVPGQLVPRWKSSYVRLVQAPSGGKYVVGSGVYNDRMERAFVRDVVVKAVAEVEKNGRMAFAVLHDPTGPFLMKDAYVFVTDMNGVELVNPAFPNLEGRNLLELTDTTGRKVNHELLEIVRTKGEGWLDYMWPKPGESVSTQKSTYVRAANFAGEILMVGCGTYLADAPVEAPSTPKPTAGEIMALVREAAAILAEHGELAYPEFRRKGSKWFRDDTYFFVFTMNGIRTFHATEPDTEGENSSSARDIQGRPYGRMILEVADSAEGEGWVHYMYPKPGGLFPAWKSAYVKRVSFPSGRQHVVGCGIYGMTMDKAFIEDVVNRAAALVAEKGEKAFPMLRDKAGPFVFMDTYVFVQTPDGTELVNPGQPTLEGKNLWEMKDLDGKLRVQEEISAALVYGRAWLDFRWYKPGDNVPARKQTFVRRVEFGDRTYIVGSGIYAE